MNLFYQPLITEGVNYLDETESRHLIKVLRKKSGDSIHITDGLGYLYQATVLTPDTNKCYFSIVTKQEAPKRPYRIHIAISPLKNPDRLEWFVEKAIEFGVDEISLINCDHTEKHYLKTDRLHKIAISAMKQSLSLRLPLINEPMKLNALIGQNADERFIAHVDHSNPDALINVATPNASYLILIGPEGDFSNEEVVSALQAGYQKVNLGPSRLRTETAGIAACHILNLVNTQGRQTFK